MISNCNIEGMSYLHSLYPIENRGLSLAICALLRRRTPTFAMYLLLKWLHLKCGTLMSDVEIAPYRITADACTVPELEW